MVHKICCLGRGWCDLITQVSPPCCHECPISQGFMVIRGTLAWRHLRHAPERSHEGFATVVMRSQRWCAS